MTDDPIDYAKNHDDGGGVPRLPQRFRFPSRYGSMLVVLLAVVAGGIGAVGAAGGVYAFVRVQGLADDSRQAQVDSFNTRRENIKGVCDDRESDRAEMRAFVRFLGYKPQNLPLSPITGKPLFSEIDGGRVKGCADRAVRLVPESNRP